MVTLDLDPCASWRKVKSNWQHGAPVQIIVRTDGEEFMTCRWDAESCSQCGRYPERLTTMDHEFVCGPCLRDRFLFDEGRWDAP